MAKGHSDKPHMVMAINHREVVVELVEREMLPRGENQTGSVLYLIIMHCSLGDLLRSQLSQKTGSMALRGCGV